MLAITLPDSPLAQLAEVVVPLQIAETNFIYKPTAARYGMLLTIDVLATELALLSLKTIRSGCAGSSLRWMNTAAAKTACRWETEPCFMT